MSQCASRFDALKRIQKIKVKKLFSKFSQNNVCIFKQASILKLDHINKLNAASGIFNILNCGKYSTLRSSPVCRTLSIAITQEIVMTCGYHTLGLKLLR